MPAGVLAQIAASDTGRACRAPPDAEQQHQPYCPREMMLTSLREVIPKQNEDQDPITTRCRTTTTNLNDVRDRWCETAMGPANAVLSLGTRCRPAKTQGNGVTAELDHRECGNWRKGDGLSD